MDVVLGVDWGGTKLALAVSDLDGDCLHERLFPTGTVDDAEAFLSRGNEARRVPLPSSRPGELATAANPDNAPLVDALPAGAQVASAGITHGNYLPV